LFEAALVCACVRSQQQDQMQNARHIDIDRARAPGASLASYSVEG